jgi:hypothetical protein
MNYAKEFATVVARHFHRYGLNPMPIDAEKRHISAATQQRGIDFVITPTELRRCTDADFIERYIEPSALYLANKFFEEATPDKELQFELPDTPPGMNISQVDYAGNVASRCVELHYPQRDETGKFTGQWVWGMRFDVLYEWKPKVN